MKLYTKCSELSIWSFNEILDTNDLRYLIKGYETGDKIIPSTEKTKELADVFMTILSEYGWLTVNPKIIKNHKLKILINILEAEYIVSKRILELFEKYENTEVLLLLNKFNHRIDLSKDINKQIEVVTKKIKSLRNNIKIHKINYDNKYIKSKKQVKMSLDKEAMILDSNLGFSYKIDPKTTTVERWINLIELNDQKSE